ncbi:hypothetical protein HY024_02160 [Candidatus Curtissbacteria bacterium]|nr:hypothetical protein [Candidatus Curtissbacteria bacterium]
MIESLTMAERSVVEREFVIGSSGPIPLTGGHLGNGSEHLSQADSKSRLTNLMRAAIPAFLRREQPGEGPRIVIIPHSPHLKDYFGQANGQVVFDALSDAVSAPAPLIGSGIARLMDKVASSDVQEHAQSSAPISLPGGQVELSTRGATVIARKGILELLYPIDKVTRDRAKRTLAVSSIDQFIAGYFSLDRLTDITIDGQRIPKQAPFNELQAAIDSMQSGDTFSMNGIDNRRADLLVLPLPPENGWVNPYLCLIGRAGADLGRMMLASRGTNQHVLIEAKKNQLEIAKEFARSLNPQRLVLQQQDGGSDFLVYQENYQRHYTSKQPNPIPGVDIWVVGQDGDIDGIVNSTNYGIQTRRLKGVSGCLGLDVVQTGRGLEINGLAIERKILPIPCHLVGFKAVKNG